ncbi:type II toxin-antitoxin system VapC family toxin [Methylopila sp. 73B]|uniref:type II toxin-antitoxin system VapC family toxin n=1 Tax=Methylopila sp. 73B TaxID=1120792 RepID=UPI00046323F2|nr:type II toxin-antitoxin system VapC family toxin [Methylopila sp. 73B]
MTRYLLDTNILSDLLRRPKGSVRERIYAGGGAEFVCTSIIVAAELRFGIAKAQSVRLVALVEGLLDRIAIEPFEEPADRVYASIRADLERRGRQIGGNDLFIAAHALALDCVLVTDNTGEFERVPDLRVENWLR